MRTRRNNHFVICLAVLMLVAFLLFPCLVEAKEPQSGDIVFAMSSGGFYQTGGDPATHWAGNPVISQTVFDSLAVENINRIPQPALAKSWKFAENWSHIDFVLRNDVKFQNGMPVTAEDIKFSLETYMRKELRFVFGVLYRRSITQVEVVGPHQVRIHFKEPIVGILGRLQWGSGMFPKAYREAVGDKGFADKPIGAGPFKWVNYKQDEWFKLEAVTNHYRKSPEFNTIKFLCVPEHSTRLAMLKSGEADIVNLIAPQVPEVKAEPNLRIILAKYLAGVSLGFADLAFPQEPSPFHDIRVRKAASLAIDRKTICEKILFGCAEPLGEAIPPVALGFDPSIKPDPYGPEAAKALLAEAGYPKGFETEFNISAGNEYWVEAVKANLAAIGIKGNTKIYEGGAYNEATYGRKLHGLMTAWVYSQALLEAPAALSFSNQKNNPWCYYTTDEIDKAITEGQWAVTDKELADSGRKISKLIRESRKFIILWSVHGPYGVNQKIEYWEPKLGASTPSNYEYIRLKR